MELLNFGPKKLGFGCMRLPMSEGTVGGEGVVDTRQVCAMVDAFLEQGFCYFDTAHGYIAQKSEPTVRQCLVERHPRDRYLLTDKLSGTFFQTEEEIRQEEAAKGKGERAFEVFCAAIFLGMIGLVFFNAFLRYVFRSSFAPSEEWARFLFIYITFIGGIEAFYRHKHIAVDMFVNMISGTSRKAVDIVASLFMLAALVLLLFGGISVVLQTLDTYSVATDVNMAFINGTLPVMAFAAIIIHLRDIVRLIRTPASEFNTAPKTE